MNRFCISMAALALAAWAIPAVALESTFERDLKVNGRVELNISNGSGSIHITRGSGDAVHVFGRVRSNWGGSDEDVRRIATNPPVEQTGNIVRIGTRHENLHNISIDYEIQAPADAYLNASSGSGQISDDGVGENAKLSTGSGGIRATSLHGSFTVDTGSGSIYAEQTGDGDVKAETGSGSIELRNLHGALRAHTGSGSIKAGGVPTGPWRLETGSGSVELWTGPAGITLDAKTGSGGIHTDQSLTMQGSTSKHHVTGKINGGGPEVRVATGSGSIRVH